MRRTLYFLFLSALSTFARSGGGGAGGGGSGGGVSGGGYHLSHYRYDGPVLAPIIGNGSWAAWLLGIVIVLILGLYIMRRRRGNARYRKAKVLLGHLVAIDPAWDETQLKEHVEASFYNIQEAWCSQDIDKLRFLLMPRLFKEWCRKIQKAKKRGHRDVMKGTKLLKCRVVNVRDYLDDDRDNFTVELHAFANDWTLDCKDRVLDRREPLFSEYWKYRRTGNDWLLEQVWQECEAGKAMRPNFIEQD